MYVVLTWGNVSVWISAAARTLAQVTVDSIELHQLPVACMYSCTEYLKHIVYGMSRKIGGS